LPHHAAFTVLSDNNESDFNLLLLSIMLIRSVIGEASHKNWLICSPCDVAQLLLTILQRPFIPPTRRNEHEEGNRCRCKHCQEQRARAAAEEEARRQALIAQAVKAERDQYVCSSYSADALPLSLAVAFLAFYRCLPNQQEGVVRSARRQSCAICPDRGVCLNIAGLA
jgi:hypothetical protein